jgi:HK97 family phage major capsid protein
MNVVVESIAYSIALEEDKNLFNGVAGGVNTAGIAGDASVDDTNVASAGALALTDLTACASGIGNPIIGAQNAWWMSPVIFNSVVRDLVNAAGGNTIADLEGGQRPLLLGYPVNFVSALPSAPASGELVAVFGDLRLGAYFGDRRALNFKTLSELYMENDQLGVVATERIDIKVSCPEVLSKITIT